MIRRHFTPEDRAASIYQYLPFEVPTTAAGFTVTLAYQRDPAIVDLGLVGPDRWGGWSGGERSEVTVTRSWATPGYVAGEVGGGWQVILGLHRVGPMGVDVTVDVEVHTSAPAAPPADPLPRAPERRPRRSLPARPGYEWLACDFHSHTTHSDGGYSIDGLATLAHGYGLDVLAVTDHNTVSHHPLLAAAGARAGMVLIPGQEVTTDTGHANAFGDIGWIDFRQPSDDWFAATTARGGLFSINHPWAGDCAWRRPFTGVTGAERTTGADHPGGTDRPGGTGMASGDHVIGTGIAARRPADGKRAERTDDSPRHGVAPFVETWHSTWDRRSDEPLTEWSRFGLTPIGGSDFHRFDHRTVPGQPTTWLECAERSIDGVFDALRAGRIAISAAPDSPLLLPVDGEIVTIDGDGCRRTTTDHGTVLTTRAPGSGGSSDLVVAFCR